jgi:two-component system nitrogen regulation response regulator NtrX
MEPRPRILLVDDEPDFIETIAFWLTAKGCPVTKADSGLKALEILQQGPQDVVFLDVNMPQMDGIETLRQIRKLHPTLPVIMVTAAFQDEIKFTEAKALGISGFFPKGTTLSQLGNVLEVALRTLRPTTPS